MSPEIVQKKKRGEFYEYDPFASDMWSLGTMKSKISHNDIDYVSKLTY